MASVASEPIMPNEATENDRTELLLQPTERDAKFLGIATHRPAHGIPMAILFLLSLLGTSAYITTVLYRFSQCSSAFGSPAPTTPLPNGVMPTETTPAFGLHAIGLCAVVFSVQAIFGAAVLLLMRSSGRNGFYLVCVLGCSTLGLGAIGFFFLASDNDDIFRSGIYGFASAILALLLLFIIVASVQRHALRRSIEVMDLASSVLKRHPELLLMTTIMAILALAISGVFFYFVYISYFTFYCQTGMTGSAAQTAIFRIVLIFEYLWVLGVLIQVTKFVLAGVAAHWYFHRNDLYRNRKNVTLLFLKYALSSSFGSLVSIAFSMSFIWVCQFIVYVFRKSSRLSKVLACCCSGILNMLERLVDQFSLYAVIRMAMTGEGLFTSKGTLLHVVRRAGISSYFVFQFVVHLALWCFAVGFAVGSSAFVYMIMALFFDGENGGVFAIFILLSSLMHARIFTTVFYTIANALFVCFLTDSDVNNTVASDEFNDNAATAFIFRAQKQKIDSMQPGAQTSTVGDSVLGSYHPDAV